MIDEDHHLGRSPLRGPKIWHSDTFPTGLRAPSLPRCHEEAVMVVDERPFEGSNKFTCCQLHISLIWLQGWVPKELARKPWGLREVGRWKAAEFRQLLLCTGSVVFPGNLCHVFYRNFLLLHVAIYILGLFQKLSSRGVGHIFFQTPQPPGYNYMGSEPPDPQDT